MSFVPIKELFHFEKGRLQSSKCTPGQYDFITAASEWKNHNSFSHECEALVFAAAASGSLGRIHYVNGKFISSDLCFILTTKNPEKYPIDLKFYHLIFQAFKEEIVRNTKSGTSKEAIGLTVFGKYKLPYFNINKQQKAKDQFVSTQKSTLGLDFELTHQLNLVKKLRQAFLREAMQGKLVPQDTKEEPSSVLLEEIKSEKERLVQEKKIKKQKPLPPIAENEIPFEIPGSWSWCRLFEVTNFIDYRGKTPRKIEKGVKLITAKNVKKGYFSTEPEEFISEKDQIEFMTRGIPNKGDILFTTEAPLGNACLLEYEDLFALAQRIITIQPISFDNKYLLFLILSSCFQDQLVSKQSGATAKGIKSSRLKELLIPLPPLVEQQQIVTKLDEVMRYCDKLEASIKESQSQNELLLQQVLREALEPKT